MSESKKSTNQRRGPVNAFGSTIRAMYGAIIPNPAKSRMEVPRNKRNKKWDFYTIWTKKIEDSFKVVQRGIIFAILLNDTK